MEDTVQNAETREFRLIVCDPLSLQILTLAIDRGIRLPREFIPAYARTAAMLTDVLAQRFGLDTIHLATMLPEDGRSHCAVFEVIGGLKAAGRRLSFQSVEDLSSEEISDHERALFWKITRGDAKELGRFARLGWINELFAKLGYRFDRPSVHQFNQGVNFCLLSFTDARGATKWFKAVGEPNIREYGLTKEFASRFPLYLPSIEVFIPEWNGWVSKGVEGTPLNDSQDLQSCEQALLALATMQKEMTGDTAVLYALGAKDWTFVRILSLLEQFFIDAETAMKAQTSTLSKPLTYEELIKLHADIESALIDFTNLGIPDTLLHGDIGHGNVIASPDGPVFLDWAETYVGHPFLSAEHLLADLSRSNRTFSQNQAILRLGYSEHWKAYTTPRELERSVAMAPAIAAFFYGVLCWNANRDRPDPTRAWPLLRSMLRRSKHELETVSGVAA